MDQSNLKVQAVAEITPLLTAFHKTGEDHDQAAEDLGRSLVRWRDEYKAQGQAGSGFKALLKHLEIPRATAYRLMRRVEPDLVSHETKPFDLELTVKGLTRWVERLPDSLKDCPEEARAQLSSVLAKLERVVHGIRADADYVDRLQKDRASGKGRCLPAPSRRRSLPVSKRSPLTQDRLDRASVGVIAAYSGDQREFVFRDQGHRVVTEVLAADLARLDGPPKKSSVQSGGSAGGAGAVTRIDTAEVETHCVAPSRTEGGTQETQHMTNQTPANTSHVELSFREAA